MDDDKDMPPPSPDMSKVSATQLTRMEIDAANERDRDYLVSQWDEMFAE